MFPEPSEQRVLVLISKALGAGDERQVRRLSQQALFLAVLSGLLLSVVSIMLSPYIPVWMGAEEAIQEEASRYFFLISLPLVFRCVSSVLGAALRAVRNTKTPMLISMAANGVNIVLNYLLIYTADLGVAGAALSSAISYVLSGVLSVLLTIGIMCVSGMLLYLGAHPLMRLFSPVAEVVNLGAEMLRLVALSEPFFGFMVVLEGIFYGLGRTRYSFFVETAGMWGVRILFTFLCVRFWELGLRAVWYCMIADNVVKALLFAVPALRFLFPGKPRSEKA